MCAVETTSAEPEAAEELMPTENKISLVPQMEASQESLIVSEPEPEPIEIPTVSETQSIQEQASVSESAQEPTPARTSNALQPGDLLYVPGFGWVPYEGPNHCEDGADIYENGNKIGFMG